MKIILFIFISFKIFGIIEIMIRRRIFSIVVESQQLLSLIFYSFKNKDFFFNILDLVFFFTKFYFLHSSSYLRESWALLTLFQKNNEFLYIHIHLLNSSDIFLRYNHLNRYRGRTKKDIQIHSFCTISIYYFVNVHCIFVNVYLKTVHWIYILIKYRYNFRLNTTSFCSLHT